MYAADVRQVYCKTTFSFNADTFVYNVIKFSWNLSASISVFGASLQQCTQYICWRHFLIKASRKSNGSSIWNNKNIDKKQFTLIPDLFGVHGVFDCKQRHVL